MGERRESHVRRGSERLCVCQVKSERETREESKRTPNAYFMTREELKTKRENSMKKDEMRKDEEEGKA